MTPREYAEFLLRGRPNAQWSAQQSPERTMLIRMQWDDTGYGRNGIRTRTVVRWAIWIDGEFHSLVDRRKDALNILENR